jgi:hypothetical protein
MPWGVVAGAAIGLVGSSMSADAAADASSEASAAQSASAAAQIAESRRQFDEVRKLLAPYTDAGPGALEGQQDILGLNGPGNQQAVYDYMSKSPAFTAMAKQGESAILQNASATGGLRGGNTQGALAQFRPQLLNQLIDQQYQRLGGLTTVGQNSAAGVGNAGQNSSSQIINALGQQGAAAAGNALAQGQSQVGMYSGLANAAGQAFGALGSGGSFGGFGGGSSNYGSTSVATTPTFTQAGQYGFGATAPQLGSGFYGG